MVPLKLYKQRGISLKKRGILLLTMEELLQLFDAYNSGEYSFAEVLLASGLKVGQLIAFMKENDIPIEFNLGFMDRGRGLNEDVLERILEMNKDDEKD